MAVNHPGRMSAEHSCHQKGLSRRNWLGSALSVAGWLAMPVSLTTIASAQHQVVISSLIFAPGQISAQAGDRVTWFNTDIVPHTATAVDHSWDTGTIEPGQQVTVQIPEGAGTEYYCLYHPSMTGRIG